MSSVSEAAVARGGDRELKARGAWFINEHGTVAGRAGIPDRVGIYRGRGFAIEYKRPDGGVISRRQDFELERIRRAGGYAIVAVSRDDVAELLDLIDTQLDWPA